MLRHVNDRPLRCGFLAVDALVLYLNVGYLRQSEASGVTRACCPPSVKPQQPIPAKAASPTCRSRRAAGANGFALRRRHGTRITRVRRSDGARERQLPME